MQFTGGFPWGRTMLLAAGLFAFTAFTTTTFAVGPTVSNVRASQRAGTQLVDVYYDVADADSGALTVGVAVSTNGGASYMAGAASFTGAVGTGVTPGSNKKITWTAGIELPAKLFYKVRVNVTALDNTPPPAGMALIPAGNFQMGVTLDSDASALPLHTVYVSTFYMDRYEVTKAMWDEVYNWATNHGYNFSFGGSGKAANHPMHTINWYDTLKWSNARSEKEGKTPAYYTSGAQTVVYRTGQVTVQNDWVNWSSGYRLPTEAEWEKAARGGLSGQRFPWGNTISWSQANYFAYLAGYAYDVNPTQGFHPTFATGADPYTSPVGYFAANGYGLYDMAGNVREWCWDWYGSYGSASQTDPRGPVSGSSRVGRGGCWANNAFGCRSAFRDYGYPAGSSSFDGFRSVLPPQSGTWGVTNGGNGHFYEVITQPTQISWTDARDAAVARGGHLATIASTAENDFIFSLGAENNRWIGGFQPTGSSEPSGGWSWITGEPFSYINWYPGEPNNNGADGAENYLHIVGGSSGWNDFSNFGSGQPARSYVVEYESMPSSSAGVSPICTVDLRFVQSGSIFGQVFGGGVPLTNAQIRVLDTPYATNSGASGGFNITNIPTGVGYVVAVAAPGFASTNIANVQVTTNHNMGVITLRPLGAHKVIPLAPDLNPAISKVEEGGVAYRYYRVVSVDGKTPAGGVTLQARLAGGATISQTGDVGENWPGRDAGVSDADGIVRIRVPSSAVGSAGTTRKVEVLDAGQVAQSFDMRILPFKHEKIWGHSLEGSVAGKLGGVRLEPGGKLETEVKDFYTGAVAYDETIERTRSLISKAGPELSLGSIKLGIAKAQAPKLGFGGYMNLQWSGKWRFAPDESNGILNMEKVYFAFGDVIFLGPLGSEFYGKLSDYWYGPGLQDLLMVGSGGEVHMGGYYDAEANFDILKIGNVKVGAGAELEGSVGGFLGYERRHSNGAIQDHTILFGFESELQGGIGATAAFSKFNGNRLRGLGGGLRWGERNTLSGRVQTDWNTGRVKTASLELENAISSGGNIDFLGWKGVELPIGGDEKVKFSETYTLTFGDASSFGKVAALGKLWQAVKPGSGMTPSLNNGGVDETGSALAGAAEESGSWTTYERSVHRSYQGEFTFPVGADALAAALELDFTAQGERGASMVVERGVAPGGRLFPQEHQPDQTRTLIPVDKVYDKELTWLSRAEFPPTSGFSRFAEYVSTANPNLTIGGRFSMFFSDVSGGAQIVGSSIVHGLLGLKNPQQNPSLQKYSPDSGETNFIYGISGLLQLTQGSNAFPGTATLVMLYSDNQVLGLNETELRIYRLPDATNRWQLIGGSVNMISNSVTTVISNFGTYAIAAPMPSGEVNLEATSIDLVANGTNQLTLNATNLLLNTGGIATNEWLFTVDAAGIELLDTDLSTNWTGVQVASSNGMLQVHLRAPLGGTYASVSVSSVAGDARGQIGVNLIDAVPPVAPANFLATAGQSRIWLSWRTNSEPDIAGYRVYYRAGTVGPPWDGTAAVEGAESPVSVTGTNCLLRGLAMGTNYFVSVAAVDTTGNESALAPAINVTTLQQPPNPPTGVAAHFGEDGTNVLMWTLSEDDGYNDRDVIRYDVWRVVMPGTNWLKVGEVEAGVGLFSETNLTVGATQYLRYAVSAVDQLGATSTPLLANRFIAGSSNVDNDGDGMADDWELANGLNPTNPADANDDPDHDGLTNLQEFLAGKTPGVFDNLQILGCQRLNSGDVELTVFGEQGRSYALEASTNLVAWSVIRAFTCTNQPTVVVDTTAQIYGLRFYRIAPLSAAGPIRVGFNAVTGVTINGIELQLDAPLGLNYRIEASTNLVNWSTVGILPGTNSPLYLWDNAATNYSRRFYRAVAE